MRVIYRTDCLIFRADRAGARWRLQRLAGCWHLRLGWFVVAVYLPGLFGEGL